MATKSFDQEFNKNFLLSMGAHGLMFLLCFAGGELISMVFRSNDVEIINSSVRVDVVGMPKFTIQELKKMEAEPVVEKVPEVVKGETAAAKPEDEDVIKKDDLVIQEVGKKKKASFLNILNDYSKKKVTAKVVNKGEAKGTTNNKHLDSLIIEGNRLSQGSALVGDYSSEQNSEFSAYVQSLPGIVRPFWKLPSYLLDKDLKCRIRIFLSPAGQFLKLELLDSSGLADFDARAEKAIRDSNFPKPSDEVGKRLTSSGIILRFPL